ncbi:putative TBP interacting domain protein [Aspergillus novofumigatus IBT 16806]
MTQKKAKAADMSVGGKHTVYHAVQDATDELTVEIMAMMDEKIKQLEEQLARLKTEEKKARTDLATLSTKPLLCELRQDVGQFEQETQAVSSRLKKIQKSDSIQVSPEERAKLGKEWRRWNRIASVRKTICRDLWSRCLEVVPDNVSREELWVSTPTLDAAVRRRSAAVSADFVHQESLGLEGSFLR